MELIVLAGIALAIAAITNRNREDALPMRLPEAFYRIDSGARPILTAKAARLFKEGHTVFLDARSPEEFALGQIDGALNVPADRWRDIYQDLLPWIEGQRTLVYSGPKEIDSADDLAGALLSRGQPRDSVFIYLGGIEEWRAAGLPVREGRGAGLSLEEEQIPPDEPEPEETR